MTHRVIEHSRTLHYVFAKHSLLVLLFLSWFSWKWSRKPIILRDSHSNFPCWVPIVSWNVWLGWDPMTQRPWRIGQWQTCKHWPKETNISRKASAKRVGRLSFFLDLFLGSNTCRSCSKALSPPTPFCLVMMFWPFLSGWLCYCTYQQSVVGSVTFPTFWIGFWVRDRSFFYWNRVMFWVDRKTIIEITTKLPATCSDDAGLMVTFMLILLRYFSLKALLHCWLVREFSNCLPFVSINFAQRMLVWVERHGPGTHTKREEDALWFDPLPYGGFLKWWYPTTIGFPTKNDHFGCFRVPPFKETPIYQDNTKICIWDDEVMGFRCLFQIESWGNMIQMKKL